MTSSSLIEEYTLFFVQFDNNKITTGRKKKKEKKWNDTSMTYLSKSFSSARPNKAKE